MSPLNENMASPSTAADVVLTAATAAGTTSMGRPAAETLTAARTEHVICVCCPCGCDMMIELDERGKVLSVQGNECARGRAHAEDEVTMPVRVLTLSLCVPGALEPLSVKTAAPIPKNLMDQARRQIETVAADLVLPIPMGARVVADVCGTGIPAIATKSLG